MSVQSEEEIKLGVFLVSYRTRTFISILKYYDYEFCDKPLSPNKKTFVLCYQIHLNSFAYESDDACSFLCNSGTLKHGTMNCFEFIESGPKVPGDVTDSIFIVQCPGNEHLILNKVKLMILLFFELKAKLKISSLTTTLLLQTILLFNET